MIKKKLNLLMKNQYADGYKRHSFYLWWSIYRFGENCFGKVSFSSLIDSGKVFNLILLSVCTTGLKWHIYIYIFLLTRQHDASIGFGASVRTNMSTSGVSSAAVTSSLMESVRNTVLYVPLKCMLVFCVCFIIKLMQLGSLSDNKITEKYC